MKIVKIKSISGFTLVESLVAISILMIAIASPMTLAQKGLSTATLSKDQMIASFLAQDAIEAVKNIRDQIAVSQSSGGWLDGNGDQFLAPCICTGANDDCNFDSTQRRYCNIDTTVAGFDISSGESNPKPLRVSYNITNGIKRFLKYDYNTLNDCSVQGVGDCGEVSKFIRYINIKKTLDNGDGANEAVVSVRVSWPTSQGVQSINIQNFIYNYSENL